MKTFLYIVATVAIAGSVSGCSTVKVPDIDFLKLPEFREIVRNNQTNVPKVNEVPDIPDDIRKATKWDEDASKLLEVRDSFTAPESTQPPRSQAEVDAEYERLKAKTQAYKLDDPE